MNKCLAAWTAVACLAVSARVEAQENRGSWIETRFHRVHLLNGNSIDGQLIQDSPKIVVLKVAGGEMSIRKDLVERNSKGDLRIEFLKMRSFKEPPKVEQLLDPGHPQGPRDSAATPAVQPPTAPATEAEAVSLTGSLEDKLNQGRELLKTGTVARKKGALEALTALGPDAAPVIAERFGDFEDELVILAGMALQGMKKQEILPVMRPFLIHSRAVVREQAVMVVGSIGGAAEDGANVRSLLLDSQPSVRGSAMIALRRLSDYESFDAVAEFLTDPDSNLRTIALVTLTEFADKGGQTEKLTNVLAKTLEYADGKVKLDLLTEAAKLGSKGLGPVLSRLALDVEPMIRAHAIMGLGRINASEYGELILDRITAEREYWPRIQLAGAAQNMRMEKSIDPLIEWLSDGDSNIRAAALRALRAITRQNIGAERSAWEEWRAKTR